MHLANTYIVITNPLKRVKYKPNNRLKDITNIVQSALKSRHIKKIRLLFRICGSWVSQVASQVGDIRLFLCIDTLENRMLFL